MSALWPFACHQVLQSIVHVSTVKPALLELLQISIDPSPVSRDLFPCRREIGLYPTDGRWELTASQVERRLNESGCPIRSNEPADELIFNLACSNRCTLAAREIQKHWCIGSSGTALRFLLRPHLSWPRHSEQRSVPASRYVRLWRFPGLPA